MSGRRSRSKGARGELEIVKLLKAYGIDCYRTPNSGGLAIKSDIQGWGDFAPEIKRQERLNLPAAWRQACEAASPHQTPIVIHRSNNTEWLATLSFNDLLGLLYHAQEGEDESAA